MSILHNISALVIDIHSHLPDYVHNTTSGETLQVQKQSEGSNTVAVDYDEELLEREQVEKKIFSPRRNKKTDYRPPNDYDHEHSHRLPRHSHPRENPDCCHPLHSPWFDVPLRGPSGSRSRPRYASRPPKHKSPLPRPDPILFSNFTARTSLTNHSLHIHTVKVKYSLPIPKKEIYVTKLYVNHQIVEVADVVSRNGVVHVINNILSPRHHYKHDENTELGNPHTDAHDDWEDWEDWEDWLIQWGAEN